MWWRTPRGRTLVREAVKNAEADAAHEKAAVCGAGDACERLTCNREEGWGSRGREREEGRTVAALLIAEM